jgi:hypothetical protein
MATRRNIVVFNPFRVGSSSIQEALNRCNSKNLKVYKLHSYSKKEREIIHPRDLEAIIVIYRPPLDRYISAFFEDCTKPEYPYYYGTTEKFQSAPISELVKHFKKFNWNEYDWLNYNYYFQKIQKMFKIDINCVENFIYSPEKIMMLNGTHRQKRIKCLFLKLDSLESSRQLINNFLDVKIEKINVCHKTLNPKYIEFIKAFKELYSG